MKNTLSHLIILLVAVNFISCNSDSSSDDDNSSDSDELKNCLDNPKPIVENNLKEYLSNEFEVAENKIHIDYIKVNYNEASATSKEFEHEGLADTSLYAFMWKTDSLVERYVDYNDNKMTYTDTFMCIIQVEIGPTFSKKPQVQFELEYSPLPLEDNMTNEEMISNLPEKAQYSGEMDIMDYVKTYELKNIGDKAAWFYATNRLIVLNGNQVIQIAVSASVSGSNLENYQYALDIYQFIENCGEIAD